MGISQDKTIDLQPKDTTVYRQIYGIRAGVDLSRPILSFTDENYTGFEIVGDYRLTHNLYIAAELGNEKKTIEEQLGNNLANDNAGALYNYTTSGNYIKLGVDYNTYGNWYGEYNSIFVGGRFAYSTFDQTLNSYSIFDSDRYWSPNQLVSGSNTPIDFSGLSATWLEAVLGAKVELFANFYLGASVRLGFLITNKEADNFKNLWIPGFNKVTDNSRFGIGYNYSLTYLLPFYKKANKKKKAEEPNEVE